MRLINIISTHKLAALWLSYLALLSAGSQAYVMQPQEFSNPSSNSIAQDYFSYEPQPLKDWSIIEFKQNRDAIFLYNIDSPWRFSREPFQLKFQTPTNPHLTLDTDPSKRFAAPEPSAWLMMCVGLLGLILVRRKSRS